MLERGGMAKLIAENWLRLQKRVIELWHLFRRGGCSRRQLDDGMATLLLALPEVLRAGLRWRDRKTTRFCDRLLDSTHHVTFIVVECVEPTNNRVDREQRCAVRRRPRSFGCQNAAGCRFVERILTVVQTLRLQGCSVLQFLHDAVQAHRSSLGGPSIMVGQ
jgi:transposase